MKKSETDGSPKVQLSHLERKAIVYVRQSSLYQVEHNLESQRRQYDFSEQAIRLGWSAEQIVIIDDDQAKTATLPQNRLGFSRIVAAVGRSEVGVVMSLEASRLARNSPDWHNLIFMCRYTNTLIADETGVYDPSASTDRMVLGIRGQMSEIEIEQSVHRMVEARWAKANRGEYLIYPPAGYELDDLQQIVMASDEAVVNAFRELFSKFDELQVVKRVVDWWRGEGLKFPVRRYIKSHPIVWREPKYQMFQYILHNPIYAGAYVFGRSKRVRELDPDDPRKVRTRTLKVNREDWPVLIKGHHPAYISYEKFEENQSIISSNKQMQRYDHSGASGPAREGWALLQGLARCGHCARRMMVSYGGSRPSPKATRTLQYVCSAARREYGKKNCQVVAGKGINNLVVEAFLEVTQYAGEEAAALSAEQFRQENEQVKRAWALQIEKAEYEAQRAQRQYDAVEPENRLVARTLEARWNECLGELDALKSKAQSAMQQRYPLSKMEIAKARRLGRDLQTVWHAETTTNQDRKQLLRAVIDEVQLRSDEKVYKAKIVWKGGATTEREVARFRRKDARHATPKDTVGMIRKLAAEFDDAQIARILNKQGRRTGQGNTFTAHRVATHRNRNNIPNCPKRPALDPREGPFTADEAAAELDVSCSTIHRWLRNGVLPGKQAAPCAPWRIVLTEELRKKLKSGGAPDGWVGLAEAAKQLGLSKPSVAHSVQAGKLDAVRVTVGGRQCWRIDVSSATCGRQEKLFDQMSTVVREES